MAVGAWERPFFLGPCGLKERVRLLLRVITDPRLTGERMDWEGETPPHTIRYGDRTIAVTPPEGTPIHPVAFSRESTGVNVVRFSPSVSRQLCLPANLYLHGKVEENGWRLGPCLGIYTRLSHGRLPFDSQTRLFRDLAKLGADCAVDVVILTPGFLRSGLGWRYHPELDTWREQPVPMPDVILRRAASFAEAQSTAHRELSGMGQSGRVHTLPSEYGDKWFVYKELSAQPRFAAHLPTTRYARAVRDLVCAAADLKDVYVKPTRRARGASVFRLCQQSDVWETVFHKRRTVANKEVLSVVRRRFSSVDALSNFWMARRITPCIVQQTIPVFRFPNGQPVDFRWLVQFTPTPCVTARVARIGRPYAVTTNLHTGGRPENAESALRELGWSQPEQLLNRLDEIALGVAEHLYHHYGPFAELGVDLALSKECEVFVLEVNPTPGRRMLRLLGTDVREMSLRNWLEYAINAAGFRDET